MRTSAKFISAALTSTIAWPSPASGSGISSDDELLGATNAPEYGCPHRPVE